MRSEHVVSFLSFVVAAILSGLSISADWREVRLGGGKSAITAVTSIVIIFLCGIFITHVCVWMRAYRGRADHRPLISTRFVLSILACIGMFIYCVAGNTSNGAFALIFCTSFVLVISAAIDACLMDWIAVKLRQRPTAIAMDPTRMGSDSRVGMTDVSIATTTLTAHQSATDQQQHQQSQHEPSLSGDVEVHHASQLNQDIERLVNQDIERLVRGDHSSHDDQLGTFVSVDHRGYPIEGSESV